ncbi:uncharacterized protein FFFS_09100 [Fusarium fujikuroi]|nr:uncharacterized protein FFFS_09100 [Fusarium fujikuroi]
MEALKKQILEVAADETFTPLSHLNILIQNLVELIDPRELISKPILPILTPSGELKLVCCATDFFIVDDMRLFKLFRDKVNMLASTSSQVMRLEPLFKWLSMGKKHLTRNVEHRVEWPYRNIPHEIEWDIGQKAEVLLRCASIAAYFRSRQTISINQRNLTLRSLRAAKMMEVEDMFSETKLGDGHHKPDNPSIYITDTYPQLKMVNSGSWQESALVAYVPADKKQRHPNIKEECLDQTEAQEAEAPLQTTRTPTSTTPEPVPAPEVNIPLADSPASQIPKFKQAGNLDAFLSIVPVPGSASGQQRQKRRPATSDSASSGSPPPLAGPKKLRKE